MASAAECNHKDWEEAQEDEIFAGKERLISVVDGQVHPLRVDGYNTSPIAELKPGESDSLESKTSGTVKAEAPVAPKRWSFGEDTQSSGGGSALGEAAPPDSLGEGRTQLLLDFVSIHGHHYKRSAAPPCPISHASIPDRKLKAYPPLDGDLGAQRACVAAQRVTAFKKLQDLKAEQERAVESAAMQKRREVRRSNDSMHEALGVAGVSAQEHLQIAQRRRKQETKAKEVAASLELQSRWYTNIPKRPNSAPAHILGLQKWHDQARREQQLEIRRKQDTIRAKQAQLRKETQAIVINTSGAYVRGSYLLKVTHRTIKSQPQQPSSSGPLAPDDK